VTHLRVIIFRPRHHDRTVLDGRPVRGPRGRRDLPASNVRETKTPAMGSVRAHRREGRSVRRGAVNDAPDHRTVGVAGRSVARGRLARTRRRVDGCTSAERGLADPSDGRCDGVGPPSNSCPERDCPDRCPVTDRTQITTICLLYLTGSRRRRATVSGFGAVSRRRTGRRFRSRYANAFGVSKSPASVDPTPARTERGSVAGPVKRVSHVISEQSIDG
jgi:hypothetical protein